jgi:hypothetical protein
MKDLNSAIVTVLRNEIQFRLKELLEQKHLYQSVRIDVSGAQKIIDNIESSPQVAQAKKRANAPALGSSGSAPRSMVVALSIQKYRNGMMDTMNAMLGAFWTFRTDACTQYPSQVTEAKNENPTEFVLPTIRVTCIQCDAITPPHNSGFRGQSEEFKSISFFREKNGERIPCQTLLFPYQCQSCKKEPLVFLVHRDGLKLTLAGRSHFEIVPVPKSIPKTEKEYYSDAVVAYNTGNVLAGLFLLRTLIEQYMRRVLSVTGKLSGDDLSDQYAKLLDDEFPQRHPSLKVIYEELSAKLHLAEKSADQFIKSREDIDRHFELLTHLPLKSQ